MVAIPKIDMAIKKLPAVNPARATEGGAKFRVKMDNMAKMVGINSLASWNIHIVMVADKIVRKYFVFHSMDKSKRESDKKTRIGMIMAKIQPTIFEVILGGGGWILCWIDSWD